MNPVLVIGATGNIGRAVVEELLAGGVPVRGLTRDPSNAGLPAAAQVVAGDLTDRGSIEDALRGVEAVFLVWTAPAESAREVIARIARSARRIVLLSAPHQTPHPFFQQPNPMAGLLRAVEAEIAASGVPATILRPGMLASNAIGWWAAQIRQEDTVRWPCAAAASAPLDERDLAEVAVRVLTEEGYEGGDYVLTGPESLTHVEQVEIIGEAIGRTLSYEEMPPEEFRAMLGERAPAAIADMLLSAWNASVGIPAYVTTTVGEITGRPPRTFREWASDHAAAFR
jgi:uncharacterized protein YbjT (DUF2867 family)